MFKYSYEFKKKCVELHLRGQWMETPEGVSRHTFRDRIRQWTRIAQANGMEALMPKYHRKKWSPEEKYELVVKVLVGDSIRGVAFANGTKPSILQRWVRKYEIDGYNGLIRKGNGRKKKDPNMKKIGTRKPKRPDETEHEELIRLRAENAYIKAEIEVIKKEIALREEKQAALLKAKKQQSSKNSEKRGTGSSTS